MACATRWTRKIADMNILSVKNLSVTFATADGDVNAVRDVSLDIAAGECLGIVGESGSGKSQLFMAVAGLLAGNGTVDGSVTLDGQNILNLPLDKLNRIRGNDIGMIFQDPLTALTPHLRIGQQMAETLKAHRGYSNHYGMRVRRSIYHWVAIG